MTKLISIVSPCYNEEENIEELVARVRQVMQGMPYRYEHIVIDNCSTDTTVVKLRAMAAADRNLKVIINARNFGHIRSPHHAILQSSGDACIWIASDLQDPPELIADFIAKWEQGFKLVMAVKPASQESKLMFSLRNAYYKFLSRISEIELVPNATGAGLYDKQLVQLLRQVDDPYPYFRGLIREFGFEAATVNFEQPRRMRGISKNNLYTLYDMAMLGIIKHSKVPLRLMSIVGFLLSAACFFVACILIILKLMFWNYFTVGIIPIMISIFFFAAVQMVAIGFLGEYIALIYTHVRRMPLVVEAERINF
jgi:glycosyltransferase involved in cell wall biosynthesis